ncbi:MAG: hypothetical protein ACXWK6_06175 [Myxococcaceae bacterium]
MAPASNITVDESLWPLLVVRLTGLPTDQHFEEFLAKRATHFARRQKHVVIYDTASFRVPTPEQRQRLISWFKERVALQKQLSLGSALVITSPIIRLTLSTVLHFAQTETPHHVTRTLSEAASWSADRLAAAGYFVEAQRVRTQFGMAQHRNAG